MDRATEALIVVVYCVALITVTCVMPLIDQIQIPVFTTQTTPRATSNSPSGSPGIHTPEPTTVVPAVASYSYTTSGYESKEFHIAVDLSDPPLIVSYQFTPRNVTRTKMVTSEYGSKETKLITYEAPSEDSWLLVSILDENGKTVDEGGFGQIPGEKKGFGNLEGKVSTYHRGKYIVEVKFNDMKGKFSF